MEFAYVNFIDFEKAFNSVDRGSLWKLMAHHGIPAKIINIIRSTYQRDEMSTPRRKVYIGGI